jgi:drug/metabolite transporter (DMT)-like permease
VTKRQLDRSTSSLGATYFALAALIFIWAANFSVVKYALRDMSPLAFNGLRVTLASIVLWVSVKVGGRSMAMDRRYWPALVGLGILGNTIYQVLFIYGIDWTLAGNASLMLAATPIFTTLLSIAFRQERVGSMAWTGVAISVVGFLTVLTASVCWSVYTVGSSPLVRRYGALPVTAVTMWIGALVLLAVSVPSFLAQDWTAVRPLSWLALFYSGAFAIALAYLIWYYSIRQLGNTRTAVYSNFIPVVALVIAWLMLSEVPTWLQLAGAAAIVGGTVLVRLGRIERSVVAPAE